MDDCAGRQGPKRSVVLEEEEDEEGEEEEEEGEEEEGEEEEGRRRRGRRRRRRGRRRRIVSYPERETISGEWYCCNIIKFYIRLRHNLEIT
jgi:hypothetical protein